MRKMNLIFWLCVLWSAFILSGCVKGQGGNLPARDYYQIVVLSDMHLPGNLLPQKEKTIATLNSWPDVDLVAVTGDIVATGGDNSEYAFARAFFEKLNKPKAFIGGNHDYIYPDSYPINKETGHHLKQPSPDARRLKLQQFKQTWALQDVFYSKQAGNYLLVFLTADDLFLNNYSEISDSQLRWLAAELQKNPNKPTIIFFHAPLQGTYASQRILKSGSPDSYNAEPADRIRKIVSQNPQVFMWVAGHLHIAPSNKDFNSGLNLYENQVAVILNPDMNGSSLFSDTDVKSTKHDGIWTNSLFLHPDRVVVRTFDHKTGVWMSQLDRVILPPRR
jgi:Icc protein